MARRTYTPRPSREVEGPCRCLVKSNVTASLDVRLYPFDNAFGLRSAHFFQRHSRSENEGTRRLEAYARIEWSGIAINGQEAAKQAAPVFAFSIRSEPPSSRERVDVQSMIPHQRHAREFYAFVAFRPGGNRIYGDARCQCRWARCSFPACCSCS